MTKKILIMTPKFPLPDIGACEKDRLAGIIQLKKLGYDVRVIAKVFDFQDKKNIFNWAEANKVIVDLFPYEFRDRKNIVEKFKAKIKQFKNPFLLDGAANEYASGNIKMQVKRIVDLWKPDLVWFDYTYLWPLYDIFIIRKIPIITRSINFEPIHFLQEDGVSLVNLIKLLPKLVSEYITVKKSNFIFAITPKEESLYKKIGAKNVKTLPLRGLPLCFKNEKMISDQKKLNIFFMASAYSVPHNRKAMEFIIKEVAPEMEKIKPDFFIFNILGGKFPEDCRRFLSKNVISHGYVEDRDLFLSKMDIALMPSFFGAGMQQKVFEPLVKGIPTITSPRVLVGYSFRDGEHLLLARNKKEFVKRILKLQDANVRRKLSENSKELSKKIFSQEAIDKIVIDEIKKFGL
jgi:glycosyltransferase involved in cell wall biosynthesis